MAKLTITIDTANAAFGEPGSYEETREILRILGRVKNAVLETTERRIMLEQTSGALLDENGNTCGRMAWKE